MLYFSGGCFFFVLPEHPILMGQKMNCDGKMTKMGRTSPF